MKRVWIGLAILSVFTAAAYSGMGTRQGGGMMNGGGWWGMNSMWLFMAVSVILVVYGVFSIMKGGQEFNSGNMSKNKGLRRKP